MAKERVALVTGGIGGIGTAICKRLADAGCKVATNYRSEEKAKAWVASCAASGYEFSIFPADVGHFDQCASLVKSVEQALGPIDILINNAGVTRDTTLRKMSPEQWQTVIDSNLTSVFNMTRQVMEGMMNRGFGRIINISSINGQKGQMGQANYSASKAGMHGFTMAVAQECARKGVTVNTISPGYIATDMVMAVAEEIRNKIISTIPVGRLGTPDEVAHAVVYLASEQSGFITGSDLSINGGQYMS